MDSKADNFIPKARQEMDSTWFSMSTAQVLLSEMKIKSREDFYAKLPTIQEILSQVKSQLETKFQLNLDEDIDSDRNYDHIDRESALFAIDDLMGVKYMNLPGSGMLSKLSDTGYIYEANSYILSDVLRWASAISKAGQLSQTGENFRNTNIENLKRIEDKIELWEEYTVYSFLWNQLIDKEEIVQLEKGFKEREITYSSYANKKLELARKAFDILKAMELSPYSESQRSTMYRSLIRNNQLNFFLELISFVDSAEEISKERQEFRQEVIEFLLGLEHSTEKSFNEVRSFKGKIIDEDYIYNFLKEELDREIYSILNTDRTASLPSETNEVVIEENFDIDSEVNDLIISVREAIDYLIKSTLPMDMIREMILGEDGILESKVKRGFINSKINTSTNLKQFRGFYSMQRNSRGMEGNPNAIVVPGNEDGLEKASRELEEQIKALETQIEKAEDFIRKICAMYSADPTGLLDSTGERAYYDEAYDVSRRDPNMHIDSGSSALTILPKDEA